jgi:hypothetical protein
VQSSLFQHFVKLLLRKPVNGEHFDYLHGLGSDIQRFGNFVADLAAHGVRDMGSQTNFNAA